MATQLELLPGVRPKFQGKTYDAAKDEKRLTSQLERVRRVMADGQWHTLWELAERVNGSEAGVSARLRDLRKERWGARTIERRRVVGGLWEYRMTR